MQLLENVRFANIIVIPAQPARIAKNVKVVLSKNLMIVQEKTT
jgi:hypothetical protein